MKKSLFIALVLLILLAACQVVPDENQSLSNTPTSSATPPTTAPATQPTVPPATYPQASPVTLPELPSVPDTHCPTGFITRDLDDLQQMYFCWRVSDTRESIIICNEWVPAFTGYGDHIFFVKESEPTKIYVTAKGDFQNHQLYYESPYGNITYIEIESWYDGYLQFIANEQRFYTLNLSTGETTFLMEQHYMESAGIAYQNNNKLWFEGRPTVDSRMGQYYYDPTTGESTWIDDQL